MRDSVSLEDRKRFLVNLIDDYNLTKLQHFGAPELTTREIFRRVHLDSLVRQMGRLRSEIEEMTNETL